MKILFLDDDPTRHTRFKQAHIGSDVTYVWTAEEAIKALNENVFDEVSLDHDLAAQLNMQLPAVGEGSGYDVALFIAGLPEDKLPKVAVIHSFNPEGAHRMGMALKDCRERGMRVYMDPFHY